MTADQLLYRFRQFWRGFHAHVTDEEVKKAAGVLPPAAFVLFQRLPVDGQRHSFNVLAMLEQKGTVPPDLAAAALLHDVGKVAATAAGLEINLWWRGPLVVLETLTPALLARLSSPHVHHGWRYLLYVHQEHPRIGAEWAAQTGCSALTCWLIAHHQDKLGGSPTALKEELLTQLQWADGQN